jgi:hypothetical protein
MVYTRVITRKTPWPESASELYQPSDRRLSGKLVPTFADRGLLQESNEKVYFGANEKK